MKLQILHLTIRVFCLGGMFVLMRYFYKKWLFWLGLGFTLIGSILAIANII